MSSKPLSLPRWNTDGTNRVTPSGGLQDSGHTLNSGGVSSYENWYKNLVYQWLLYLSDGALVGNHNIDGDLGVTGDATVDGALDVAGAATVTGDLSVLGAFVGPVNVTGTVEADQLYFRQTETRQLDIHGMTSFGTHAPGYEESTGAAQIVDVLIDLPLGAKIYGYSLRVYGNGTDNLTHKLVKITDGVETPVGAVTMTAPAATWQDAFNNFAPEQVYLRTRYVIRVTAGGSGQRVGAPAVDWTREAP